MQTFWAGSEKRLAIVLRPRGGDWLEEELLRLKNDGIDVIVSMLEPQEASELGLAAEGALCARVGLSFRSFPVVDRDVPDSLQRFAEFARELLRRMQAGEAIGVHCRASSADLPCWLLHCCVSRGPTWMALSWCCRRRAGGRCPIRRRK